MTQLALLPPQNDLLSGGIPWWVLLPLALAFVLFALIAPDGSAM